MKITNKDFKLIDYALDILASDYDIDNSVTLNGTPEQYRVKMQKEIEKLKIKLAKIEKEK